VEVWLAVPLEVWVTAAEAGAGARAASLGVQEILADLRQGSVLGC
jgi:hypothetical protein